MLFIAECELKFARTAGLKNGRMSFMYSFGIVQCENGYLAFHSCISCE